MGRIRKTALHNRGNVLINTAKGPAVRQVLNYDSMSRVCFHIHISHLRNVQYPDKSVSLKYPNVPAFPVHCADPPHSATRCAAKEWRRVCGVMSSTIPAFCRIILNQFPEALTAHRLTGAVGKQVFRVRITDHCGSRALQITDECTLRRITKRNHSSPYSESLQIIKPICRFTSAVFKVNQFTVTRIPVAYRSSSIALSRMSFRGIPGYPAALSRRYYFLHRKNLRQSSSQSSVYVMLLCSDPHDTIPVTIEIVIQMPGATQYFWKSSMPPDFHFLFYLSTPAGLCMSLLKNL